MPDGQGSLLPVRHFRREGASHALSSCSDLHNGFRSESSAESNPNPNPVAYLHPGNVRSDVEFPCSLDASDSNIGEIVPPSLSKSAACHCFPVKRAKAEDAQFCDVNGSDVGREAASILSSWFDYASAGHSSSISPPIQEAETGTSSNYVGDLDGVDTCLRMSCGKSSDINRSAQTEERCDSGHEMGSDLVLATSCGYVAEEGGVRTVGEADRHCGACKFNNVHAGQHTETSKASAATSSGALDCISNHHCNMKDDPEFVMRKEIDDSTSQSVCTEEVIGKECLQLPAAQSTCPEVAFPARSKRLRILNGFMASGGSGSPHPETANESENGGSGSLHSETADESENGGTNDQQQPFLPGLDNETALRCFASVPISALGQLAALGRQYRNLVKSRLIFKLRSMYGMVEHLVFIYTSAGVWTAYDANQNLWRTLPTASVNHFFNYQDRESLSAGTHVLWLGKEMFDFVYYRYDLIADSWERGPSMVNPRCLFASASCGEYAYVAGGFGPANDVGALRLLNTAEKYNSVTAEWELLPPMHVPRHKCSGFFMDGKFYVIGGRDANHQPIRSGEEYDLRTGLWREIPNMYFVSVVNRRDMFEPSPPLVAVVNNHLYAVENSTNILKMYNKHDNTWSNLGYLPVQADLHNGWGVAFKALGDRLFLMGDLEGITAYSWQPGANPAEPDWKLLCRRERSAGSFLYNCAVMNC